MPDDIAWHVQVEAISYRDIQLSLGVDDAASILFATDSVKQAATMAGWRVALAVRPSKPAVPADASSKFKLVLSMAQSLDH